MMDDREDLLKILSNLDDASVANLLYIQSSAMTAERRKYITREQLLTITDWVERTSLMQKGLKRDVSFEAVKRNLTYMLEDKNEKLERNTIGTKIVDGL